MGWLNNKRSGLIQLVILVDFQEINNEYNN